MLYLDRICHNTLTKGKPMELIVQNGEIQKAYGYDEPVIKIPKGITRLCEGIFTSFIFLTHIELPDGLKYIDEHVFNNCVVLEEAIIPDSVCAIGEYAFQYCLKMSKLHLPLNLKRVESCTFRHCSSLKEVLLPENVEFVDYDAFFGCEKLERFVALNSRCEFGQRAFYNCKSLKYLDAPRALKRLDEEQLSRVCANYCRDPESFSDASKAAYEELLRYPSKRVMELLCEKDEDDALAVLLKDVLDVSRTDEFLITARKYSASKCVSALLEYKNKKGIGGIDAMMSEFEI